MFIITEKEFINADHIRSIKVSETKPHIIEAVANLGESTAVLYSYDCTHDIALARIRQLTKYGRVNSHLIADERDVKDIENGNITQADRDVISNIKIFVYRHIHKLVEDIAKAKGKGAFVYDVACFYED